MLQLAQSNRMSIVSVGIECLVTKTLHTQTDSRIDILYGLCHTIKNTQGTEGHAERD